MKIAVNEKYGDLDSIKIIDAETPNVLSNEILVKVVAVGLNPKDILVRKGKFKRLSGSKFPQGIGFDFAGIVENPNNSPFKKGDYVFGMLNGMIGRCCAEYLNIKTTEVFKMPKNTSFEAAAGIPLAAQTSLQAIRNLGKLNSGKKILINGASGGVGTLAIQIAKTLGGEITTVSSTKNLDFCKSFGAHRTLSYQNTNLQELNEQFDVFYDVFGNYSFKKVKHLLTKKGIYITTVPKAEIIQEQFFNFFRSKKAKLVVVKSNKKDLQWLCENIENSNIKPVVDKVFSLDEIKTAQQHIETKRAKGKVILKIQ